MSHREDEDDIGEEEEEEELDEDEEDEDDDDEEGGRKRRKRNPFLLDEAEENEEEEDDDYEVGGKSSALYHYDMVLTIQQLRGWQLLCLHFPRRGTSLTLTSSPKDLRTVELVTRLDMIQKNMMKMLLGKSLLVNKDCFLLCVIPSYGW